MDNSQIISDLDVEVFSACYHDQPAGWVFCDSQNAVYRVWCVLNGRVCMHMGEHRLVGVGGQCLFLPSSQRVYFSNNSEERLVLWSVLFTMRPGIAVGAHPVTRPIHLQQVDQFSIMRLIQDIHAEQNSREIGFQVVMNARLKEILVHCLRRGNFQPLNENGDPSLPAFHPQNRLYPVIQALQNRPQHYLSTAEMAEIIHVSEGHLRRLFQEYLSMTPNQFVQQFKVNQSKRLLSERNLTITEIVESLGFAHPNYFSKVFRQHVGCSPREYRKALKKEV